MRKTIKAKSKIQSNMSQDVCQAIEDVYSPYGEGNIDGTYVLEDMFNFFTTDDLSRFLEHIKSERDL
jgi:hypothetical protein